MVTASNDAGTSEIRRAHAQPALRRVQKPVSKAQVDDPRTFQLSQVRRRYKPEEDEQPGATTLHLKIVPTDPDFPFDIEALEATLTVPAAFPKERPALRVTNHEMGRGYQLNVEAGFASIVAAKPNGTLLSWLNALDQQLEQLLSKEKAETVKIVVNQKKAPSQPPAEDAKAALGSKKPLAPVAAPVIKPSAPSYGTEALQTAQKKRELETRQLEARLGRLPQYAKSSDGVSYTLPIEPRKRNELPIALESIKTIKLIVPRVYNLQPCQIQLQGVPGREADAVQAAFEARCKEHPDLSLLSHINFLTQNVHTMAKIEAVPEETQRSLEVQAEPQPATTTLVDRTAAGRDEDRSHIVTIPRPPEWDNHTDGESTDSEGSYFSDSSSDEGEEAIDEEEDEPQPADNGAESSQPQRGILMSFPNLEIHGIELLEVYSVSLEIKCERCKTQIDVQNVKNNAKLDTTALRSESCKKCANSLSVGGLYDSLPKTENYLIARHRLQDGFDTRKFKQSWLSRS